MWRLVVDSKIPYLRGFAEMLGEVRYVEGSEISPADVRHADALVVRTRTRCDAELLEGSDVKFVATATIGYDHLDTAYLRRARIGWANCPGCNARSVAQYVECALLLLAAHGAWGKSGRPSPVSAPLPQEPEAAPFARLTLGIVGVGHVGSQVLASARRMGFGRILLCDPPRAEREGGADFVPLETLAAESDVVTFHTPLTLAPLPHPTYHLADAAFFARLKAGAVFFNTSRGEVADTEAVKRALRSGRLRAAVIDTWEREPHIDPALLSAAWLATPHIAGYSADGKAAGSRMALQAVARHFGLDPAPFAAIAPPPLPPGFAYYPAGEARLLCEALRLYDPSRDSLALKADPSAFERLRGHYPLRREQAQ